MTITPENRKRFEEMGCEKVQLDFNRGIDGGRVIDGRENQLQAAEWIGEQTRKRRRKATCIAMLTLIIAAIAAAPVIKHGIERLIHASVVPR